MIISAETGAIRGEVLAICQHDPVVATLMIVQLTALIGWYQRATNIPPDADILAAGRHGQLLKRFIASGIADMDCLQKRLANGDSL